MLLLLGSFESDGGSTGSGVHALQRDGSHLVVQGVKALGIAVLGGELQNVNNVSLLVSLDIAGDDDALAVSQTLACQVLALVLRACIVQPQRKQLRRKQPRKRQQQRMRWRMQR